MQATDQNPLEKLLGFLDRLEGAKISYRLEHARDAIMVRAFVPEGLWEIEFFADGLIEVERFLRGEGVVEGTDEMLESLIAGNS